MKKRPIALTAAFLFMISSVYACAPAASGTDTGSVNNAGDAVKEISRFEVPEFVQYPSDEEYFDEKTGEFDSEAFEKASDAWYAQNDKRVEAAGGSAVDPLWDFMKESSKTMLTDKSVDSPVFSPLSVYLAFGILSDITSGNTQQQILDATGASSTGELAENSQALWNAVYTDDGMQTALLADSLWISKDYAFNEDAIKKAAEDYNASVYGCEFGNTAVDDTVKQWINSQTKDLLKDSTEGLQFSKDDVLALISAIYYKSAWSDEFAEENNKEDVFKGISGDVSTEFMNQTYDDVYAEGENFSSVRKSFVSGGSMYFILPDEGTTTDEIINGTEMYDYLKTGIYEWENAKNMKINLSMPKFDSESSFDLVPVMEKLGITDAFDPEKADFSELSKGANDLYVSEALHNARVTVNETGVEAAAYTMIAVSKTAFIEFDEVDFKLNRPFIYVIMNDTNVPLFIGVVNNIQK